MVAAFNTAIAGKANGIGCCLIDNTAFNKPVDTALSHGIPVIAYNADVSAGVPNNRQAYVGQNNLTAGAAVAQQILKQVKKGDLVAGIIATPGTGNIQPRIDGAKPVLTKAGINFVEVGTSATEGAPEYNKISAWYAGHKDVKFMFAVDSGDSDALAQLIQKNNLKGKVGAAGWDVGTPVVQGINAGNLTFTIDQQAYLQGFDTIMQLYLFNVSGGLMKPTNTDTGLGIVVKGTVAPYLAKNRFEGTNVEAGGPEAAGLDPALVSRACFGRSNACSCPGGRAAGAAAQSRGGRASRPAPLPLPARADADPDHGRAVRVLHDQGRVDVHRAPSASARPPAMRGRSGRSPSARCCCSCSPRSTCRPARSSCSRRGSSTGCTTSALPLALAILIALLVCLRCRRDQRADHGAPERALLRHDAGDELHPLRARAHLFEPDPGDAHPALGVVLDRAGELRQPDDGGLAVVGDPLGAGDHDPRDRAAQTHTLRRPDRRHGRESARRSRGGRAGPARQGVVLRALLRSSPASSASSTRSSTAASTPATSASTTSSTRSAPA